MARCTGPGGMVDVLSLAILEDLKYDNENGKVNKQDKLKSRRYYGSVFFQELPKDADVRNPKLYDQPVHWLHCACASAMVAQVFGILNILPLFIPTLKYSYKIGALEGTVVSAATYAIVFVFAPLASALVKCMGNRLTCIFGLLLLFGGLVLDALEVHPIGFYVGHLVLIGLGSCFTLTAAASSILRHFRVKLVTALTVLSVAAPVGTVLFQAFYYVMAVKSDMTYKWILLSMSIIVLVSICLTHPLPKSPKAPRHPNPFMEGSHQVHDATRECVNSVGHRGGGDCQDGDCEDNGDDSDDSSSNIGGRKSSVCVCVLDLSSLTDIPFLLWTVISSCAAVTLYVPCAFLLWNVQVTFNFAIENCLYLIFWFCLGSGIGRAVVMMSKNHTFRFNQAIFMAGTAGSAVLYSILYLTTTYGWFLVWCFFGGLCEGFVVGAIPRLTLQTIPRKYMAHCWGYIVFCNGAATIIGPYLLMYIRVSGEGDLAVACAAIGIIQICAAALAIFLPNEYGSITESEDETKASENND